MNKVKLMFGIAIAFISMAMATISANSACAFYYHQPKLPEKVGKLRKF